MSKTIAQELTELAEWVEAEGRGLDFRFPLGTAGNLAARLYKAKAAEIRALAERCRDKVLIPVARREAKWGPGNCLAWINPKLMNLTAHGINCAEADANLQALLDKGGA